MARVHHKRGGYKSVTDEQYTNITKLLTAIALNLPTITKALESMSERIKLIENRLYPERN